MNIGIVVRTLRIGGMERVAANLADAFQDQGHSVTLIYLKNKPVEILPERKDTDIRLINLDRKLNLTGVGFLGMIAARLLNIVIRKSLFVWAGFMQSLVFSGEIKKIEAEKGAFDLFIIRGQGTFEMTWAYKDSRVVQVCENIFANPKSGFPASWYARLLFNGKKVVSVSNGVFEDFWEYQKTVGIKPESLTMITNPVNVEKIRERRNEKIPEIPDKPYILGLGRFVPQKNFSLLIRAYKVLVDKYGISQSLVLVGDGREREKLKSLAGDLGLSDRVIFPGATGNPYAWMAAADLFVLSSDFEGLGMVILEAFASGVNVVATNSPGGVSDIMGSAKLRTQLSEMTPEKLAEKIHMTLGQPFPDYEAERVLERFGPESITSAYLDLIG